MTKQLYSLEDFEDWIKTKDPEEEYVWFDANVCAMAQYSRDRGAGRYPVAPKLEDLSCERPWNFKSLLARTQELLAAEGE